VVTVRVVRCGPGPVRFVVEGAEGATDGGFVDGGAVAVGGEEVVADFAEEESCHLVRERVSTSRCLWCMCSF
jgi:hypothetical protein